MASSGAIGYTIPLTHSMIAPDQYVHGSTLLVDDNSVLNH